MATEREDALYEAMTAADWETVDQLHWPDPPDITAEGDYNRALGRYHADNEMSEEERENNGKSKAKERNDHANAEKDKQDKQSEKEEESTNGDT